MKLSLSANLFALTVSSIMSISPAALAQGDALLSETQDILNSEQIDIDGTYKKETAADRIEKMRKKLEAQNEQMVQKKIEDIRIKQETELSNKLQKAFTGNLKAMDSVEDSVGTYQAAPQRVIAPMPTEEKSDLKNKIIPFFGVKQFDGESIDSFEAKVNAGLSMENMITERLSVGLGVNYTAMDITDVAYYNGFNQFNFGFNDGDEISYTNLNVSINGKFFITKDSKIRPYIGAGVGYNRTSLKYDEQNSQFNNGFGTNFNGTNEDSKVSGSNVTGTGAVGAEILFTETIGVNLEFNYTRALTSAFDVSNTFNNGFNDQAKANLETLGDNLEESDVAALNIGFVVKF